jgi:hypothetical protein
VTSSAATATLARGAPSGFWSKVKPPHLFSALITVLLVVGEWRFQILDSYWVLIVALGTAIASEALLSRWLRGAWPSVLSAYISGNSIAILTKPQAGILWPFGLGALIAITSKYVLTYRGRHLWNPTNFSISAMLLLAPGSVAVLSHEWGNELWTVAVIWAIGLAVVTRAKLLHITLTYLASFVLLGGVRAAITGANWLTEIAPITGPMYQLLLFFMLTDPRTTVSSRKGRIAVVILIACGECVLRLANDYHAAWAAPFATAPAIFALAVIGPIAMVIDLSRKPAPQR